MRCLVAVSACCLLFLSSGRAHSQENDIVKIEEFWELVVRDPDAMVAAPQVTNSFAPVRQGDVLYATFSLNHHTRGDGFREGGVQLQLWHGERLLAARTSDKNGLLGTPGEVVTWTQEISLQDGVVSFSIRDGQSQTWSSFGGPLSLAIQTNLTSLNDYRPNDSIDHSGVVYAANRVTSLKLKKVRATFRSGTTKTVVGSEG